MHESNALGLRWLYIDCNPLVKVWGITVLPLVFPDIAFFVEMDVLQRYRPTFLEHIPISIQLVSVGVIVTLVYTVYSLLTVEQPLKGFPVVALTEKGLSSKWSWYTAGPETIAKGLKEHNGPFQIITGTGPKVCHM